MRFHALPAWCLLAAFAAGCGSTTDPTNPTATTSPPGDDRSAVLAVMETMPELAEDDLFLSDEETELGAQADMALGRRVAPTAAIRPWRYWRTILDIERRFEFEFFAPDSNGDPTRAFVTIHRRLAGTFNIATPTPAPGDSADAGAALASTDDPAREIRIVRKRLRDHWVRRVALVRVETENSDRRIWRIAGTSGVRVRSPVLTDAVPPPGIQSLRIVKADLDTTITDPLQLLRLKQIMHATPGEEVTLTVTTTDADDVVVLLHRGLRFRFQNNGDGTHSGVWRVPRVAGVHHFGVNALAHGTLFDDEAPYQSDAWILPYVTVAMNTDDLP